MSAIKINQLTKKYGKIKAVDQIDLEISDGDFFGFIGPNGAGKTTTIKTMLNLLNPYTGEIKLLGNNIKKNMFQSQVGYVPGEANLYGNLKVKEQINYFGRYFDKLDHDYINQLKEMFEIEENKKISQLSLGNKKKVAIICALMNKPKLLIFDEVTNSLDPIMQRVLFDELLRLNGSGTTIFFSSHNLEEVQTYCKNIAIIRGGKIIKHDNVKKILATNGVEVTVKTNQKLNPGFFEKHNLKHDKIATGAISFIYKGDLDELIYYLSKYKLDSVRISDVRLEDIFDGYYIGGNNEI